MEAATGVSSITDDGAGGAPASAAPPPPFDPIAAAQGEDEKLAMRIAVVMLDNCIDSVTVEEFSNKLSVGIVAGPPTTRRKEFDRLIQKRLYTNGLRPIPPLCLGCIIGLLDVC